MLYLSFLHHDCTTFRRFLLELSHDIGQDELIGVQVFRRLGEGRVAVHLLEPVELPAFLQQANPALVTEIMEVQVDRLELGTRLGGEAVAVPCAAPLGHVPVRLQDARRPLFLDRLSGSTDLITENVPSAPSRASPAT
jgi:hypothetical protein